jgi:predicted phosphate transport protein (TIGR00153 family)
MRIRLTPREDSFYTFFTQAAANLVTGADLLTQMMTNGNDRAALAEQLKDVEHASDEVTHEVFKQLNSSFITPFDREDIYQLGSTLDDVMDAMEAAGDLVLLYGLEQLPAEIEQIVDVLARCARVTAEAMPRLKSMKDLEEYWIEANRLENEADQAYRRLLKRLFSGEYDALTVLKLKEVGDMLEEAADAFEHVANAVETIVVKES